MTNKQKKKRNEQIRLIVSDALKGKKTAAVHKTAKQFKLSVGQVWNIIKEKEVEL